MTDGPDQAHLEERLGQVVALQEQLGRQAGDLAEAVGLGGGDELARAADQINAVLAQLQAEGWAIRRALAAAKGHGGIDANLGEFLRAWREAHGLPQSTIAHLMDRLGIPWRQNTVADLEPGRGARRFTLVEVLALAGITGVPVVDLLTWTGEAILPWGVLTREELGRLLVGSEPNLADQSLGSFEAGREVETPATRRRSRKKGSR